jgi:hypothetical protein
MMAQWINVKRGFEYNIAGPKGRGIVSTVVFTDKHLGDHFVKDEIAEFATTKGHASKGKAKASSRSTKGGKRTTAAPRTTSRKASTAKAPGQPTRAQTGATRGRKTARNTIDVVAANLEPAERLAGENADDDGAASDGRNVDKDAS